MQPQANPAQATQAAMQQAKAPQPALKTGQINVQPQAQGQPQQQDQGQQPAQGNDQFDAEILKNLEDHLNSLDPRQKQFLASSLQHYANIVIPVLGIVCGQEVFTYFTNLYKQHFAKGAGAPQQPAQPQQPNSAPNPAQGQQPNQAAQPQPQQAQAQAQPAQQPQM